MHYFGCLVFLTSLLLVKSLEEQNFPNYRIVVLRNSDRNLNGLIGRSDDDDEHEEDHYENHDEYDHQESDRYGSSSQDDDNGEVDDDEYDDEEEGRSGDDTFTTNFRSVVRPYNSFVPQRNAILVPVKLERGKMFVSPDAEGSGRNADGADAGEARQNKRRQGYNSLAAFGDDQNYLGAYYKVLMRNPNNRRFLKRFLNNQRRGNRRNQLNGLNGSNGLSGLSGLNGLSGINGLNGLNGLSGLNGSNRRKGNNPFGSVGNALSALGAGDGDADLSGLSELFRANDRYNNELQQQIQNLQQNPAKKNGNRRQFVGDGLRLRSDNNK